MPLRLKEFEENGAPISFEKKGEVTVELALAPVLHFAQKKFH